MSRYLYSCLLIVALAACKGETSQPPPERSAPELRVTVESVQTIELTPTITLSGQLVARETVRMFSEVDGLIVQRVLVEAGDTVRAGQPLLLVDTKSAQLELEQATAQRAQALIDSQRLRQELARMRSVADIGGVSHNVLTNSELQLEAAEEYLRAATAARDIAEHRLNQALFRAPFAGVVLQRDVEVGDRTGSSSAPYFVLARDGDIEFEAFGTTRQLEAIEPGMPAQVRAEGHPPQPGLVRAAAVAVDSNTRSGRVRIQPTTAPFGSG